jgi:hypothetical protein
MKRLLLIILFPLAIVIAQDKSDLSGSLSFDSKISFDNTFKTMSSISGDESSDKKSPILAATLSAVIPGSGQFYTKNYLKSILFIALEVTAISVGLMYDKKGDDQTNFFQNYADQHWSALRYAKWTVTNATKINPAVDPSKYAVITNNNTVNWGELNRLENDISNYYSHRLPKYGDQQYYELIGKYPQFVMGWDDFGDENTPFEYDVERKNLTARFYYYADERGKANEYYNVASKAVLIVMINHIASAVEAAWGAASYNNSLKVSAQLKKSQIGFRTEYIPQLNLQYNF